MSELLSHLEKQLQQQESLLRERERDLGQLRRDLDRITQLNNKRTELLAQLRGLDTEIAALEQAVLASLRAGDATARVTAMTPVARPATGSRTIPMPAARMVSPPAIASGDPQVTTLKDEIRKVLGATSSPLGGAEIAKRVKAGGYKTSSENFAAIVKKHLTEMDDVTQVLGRGYRLKK